MGRPAIILAILISWAGPGQSGVADDSNQLTRALVYSREFLAGCHLVAKVDLRERDGSGRKDQFQYDRYPDVERIRLGTAETYARKRGARWLNSNDWGKTGRRVSPDLASKLDNQITVADVAWNTNHTSYDQTQGADVVKLLSRSRDKDLEHFVFERTREHPTGGDYPRYTFTNYSGKPGELILEEFSGPVRLGDEKLFLTVRYIAMLELKGAKIEILKKGR